uniref:UBC core domain-containing protein n=1 Tax=Chenopodium quinoa TaxID=63459 RepID=A0A803KVT9_CHEQI
MSDDNLFVWSATIFGPDETPWEGGVFSLRLTFTDNYPEKPPRVRFTSDIFHPNGNNSLPSEFLITVYHDGTLCMDIIQEAWSPCHNVATILTSIQSLLTDPNPSSPANPEAAQLFQHDSQAYNKFVTSIIFPSLSLEIPL